MPSTVSVTDLVRRHLDAQHADLMRYWRSGGTRPEASVEAHCDVVYALALLGERDAISPKAADGFVAFLRGLNLPGWKPDGEAKLISVHNCAYAFGALNLIPGDRAGRYDPVLARRTPQPEAIVDPATQRPVFPPAWAHHNWRVSHWIGGVPSMLLSLEQSGATAAKPFAGLLAKVREATEGLIDERTGLLRAYRSALVQAGFRFAYRLRHDPDLGDVGGVAHILWIDHAIGRRYTALEALHAQAAGLFAQHAPFMEAAPYCLDFDIVQVVRTAQEQLGRSNPVEAARARQMMADIEAFFAAGPAPTYTLHKATGALATWHECALLAGTDVDGRAPLDIIKAANWL